MADRAQASKVVGYVMTGIDDVAKASKVVAYMWLEPGTTGDDATNRQGHVYTQILRRG